MLPDQQAGHAVVSLKGFKGRIQWVSRPSPVLAGTTIPPSLPCSVIFGLTTINKDNGHGWDGSRHTAKQRERFTNVDYCAQK